MALYGMDNFAFGDVSATFDASQTTLSLSAGDGSRFSNFPAMANLWNTTDYASAHAAFVAGDAEIIEIVSKSSDVLDEIKRGQDGTAGIATTTGANYRVEVIASRSQWDKVCRAQPDGAGPFDAILAGTPLAVVEAVARFVRNTTNQDCIHSIQGSDANADATELWLGNTVVPNLARLKLLKNSATTDALSVILNAIEFITMQGRDRMGILKATPSQPGGLNIGQTVSNDRFSGLSQGSFTISGGVISSVSTSVIRITGESSPAADDLDTINLLAAHKPSGNRVMLFLVGATTAEDITVTAAGNINLQGPPFKLDVQDDMLGLISDGTDNDTWVEIFRTRRANYVHVRDEKASATGGGTFTSGAWRTRDLNTIVRDTDGIASLSSNQVTLEAGKYVCHAMAPANEVNRHQLRVQNITDAATLLTGHSCYSSTAATNEQTAHAFGYFELNGSKAIEVQHRCNTTKATIGFGAHAGFTIEVYAGVEFRRLEVA